MRLAILCGHPDSAYARRILSALVAQGRTGTQVIAAEAAEPPRSFRALWQAHGTRLPGAVAGAALRRVGRCLAPPSPGPSLRALCEAQGGTYLVVPEINGGVCADLLRALAPDLVLLGGAPILRAPILAVPRLGTLNAHQGPLPRYRGMNVLEWTVLDGRRPSLTVHFVDPGVDTGDIIMVEPVPILPGDSLDRLKERAARQQVDLLCRTVARAEAGPLPRHPQPREAGRQYFVLHPRLRALAEARLQQVPAVAGVGSLPSTPAAGLSAPEAAGQVRAA